MKNIPVNLQKMLHGVDVFPRAVPTFTLLGKNNVTTPAGGCVTLFIFGITMLFACVKLQQMLLRHNPDINSFIDHDVIESDETFDTSQNDFTMAFAL